MDLLGFESVSNAVAAIIMGSDEPIAVGLHGAWGSGKSSLLRFVRDHLAQHPNVRVIEVNPWEFDDHADVKGTLIGVILGELAADAEKAGLGEKLKDLLKRISWTRAAAALARGALTMQWDPDKLVEAFSPQPKQGGPTNMAGFRSEFAELLDGIECEKVVLLVDDLDRCLPGAVLATLEAVKLFLSVPKMAFVVAADQEMVREAIAAGLGETRRSVAFARDYLEKIIQVPVGLPQPTSDDAACYVALLLARSAGLDSDATTAAIAHAKNRRAAGQTPYLAEERNITVDQLTLAQQATDGLGSDDVVNPRRVKRFLNALAVRQHAASDAGVQLAPDVIAKLFLLEHRHPELIRALARVPSAQRQPLLAGWEEWAADGTGEVVRPAEVAADEMKPMLRAMPQLTGVDTDSYFDLARRFLNVRVASSLSAEARGILTALVEDVRGSARAAADKLPTLQPDERMLMAEHLVASAHTAPNPNPHLLALLLLLPHGIKPELFTDVARTRRQALQPGTGLTIRTAAATISELAAFADELQNDSSVDEMTRHALEPKVAR